MARTVTQITLDTDKQILYALCNDGTMWSKENIGIQIVHQPDNSEQAWVQIQNVPQT